MRILLVGHGRMGRLVGDLAGEYGCEVAGIIDPLSASHSGGPEDDRWRDVAVAIDFSLPEAVAVNVPALARRGINLVIGTTGWQKDEPAIRTAIATTGAGVVSAIRLADRGSTAGETGSASANFGGASSGVAAALRSRARARSCRA